MPVSYSGNMIVSFMRAALLSSFSRSLYSTGLTEKGSLLHPNVFSSDGLRFLLDNPWKVQRVKIKKSNDNNKYNNYSLTSTILGTVLFNAN